MASESHDELLNEEDLNEGSPEEFSGLPDEEVQTAVATVDLHRALHVGEVVNNRLAEVAEPSRIWALSQIVRLEALNPHPPKGTEEWQKHLKFRERQAELLIGVKRFLPDQELREALEIVAEEAHKRSEASDQYLRSISGRVKGYFFEVISRRIPLSSGELMNFLPLEEQEEERAELERYTLGAVRSVREWKRGNILSELVVRDLLQADEFAPLKGKVYIHSRLRDPKGEELERHQRAGRIILQFDGKEKRWRASGEEDLLKSHESQVKALEDKANTLNEFHYKVGGRPDNLIYQAGQVVGYVEAKCWAEEELLVFLEHLEEQSAEDIRRDKAEGGKIGRFFEASELNLARRHLGKPPQEYPGGGFTLTLNLAAENRYVLAATLREQDVLAVLRVPSNLSLELLKRLQEQLERRGQEVLTQQVALLSSEEVEEITLSHIRSLEFAETLQERWEELARDKTRSFLLLRNLRARALALGIRKLEDLEKEEKPAEFFERDFITDSFYDRLRAEKADLKRLPPERGELLRVLREHYRAYKSLSAAEVGIEVLE